MPAERIAGCHLSLSVQRLTDVFLPHSVFWACWSFVSSYFVLFSYSFTFMYQLKRKRKSLNVLTLSFAIASGKLINSCRVKVQASKVGLAHTTQFDAHVALSVSISLPISWLPCTGLVRNKNYGYKYLPVKSEIFKTLLSKGQTMKKVWLILGFWSLSPGQHPFLTWQTHTKVAMFLLVIL